MGSKIGSFGRIYQNTGKTTMVASGTDCPKISIAETTVRFKDDFSKGFKIGKSVAKKVFG